MPNYYIVFNKKMCIFYLAIGYLGLLQIHLNLGLDEGFAEYLHSH